ncbi:MAG: metal-sensitive transcriptional regulator [Trueperaceae bacterium]|nr:metal-sensitive transcriptional regulator [Truepera sp.]HRN18887.1 metal-sensitive transcriptional regulator [Trueperaceae bacterium]HRQ11225.1 metal-sensitive transcriptional regulator [Trueperaceae bacterium]
MPTSIEPNALEARRKIVNRLKRLEGQVRGLQRMIEEERPCREVLTLVAGTRKALDAAGDEILANYLTECRSALAQGEQDVEELLTVIKLARG